MTYYRNTASISPTMLESNTEVGMLNGMIFSVLSSINTTYD